MIFFDYKAKMLYSGNTTTGFNPFDCSFTFYKINSFFTPVLIGSDYVYQEAGVTKFTFKLSEGKIRLPVRRDYVFTDQNGNVIESTYDLKAKSITYYDIEPENLRVSRIIHPSLSRTGTVLSEIYPEWFGAKPEDELFDNQSAFQHAHLCRGTLNLSPATYWMSGDVVLYDKTIIRGNYATLKLLANSICKCLYEIETRTAQDGITIYDLNIEGNKKNNVIIQDGIYSDWLYGIYYDTLYGQIGGYSFDNVYIYNGRIQNFTGSGIACACPGTSHIYSSYLAFNAYDGITWLMEHFTLTNVTSWGNGRHGLFTGGNHWRIIGGAYAHNGAGSNIHCDGATTAQIIGCSCIHSGKFSPKAGGGYIASTNNVYGYVWAGAGLGTHELIGGDGIFMKNSSMISIIGARVSGANANAINMDGTTNQVNISNCIFEQANLVQKDYKHIGGTAQANARIDNCKVDGVYIVASENKPIMFGTSTGSADWNDLRGTLPGFRANGIFEVRDANSALNRPATASANLLGTIKVSPTYDESIARVFIELMDSTCSRFYRYMDIDMSTGVYSNDTGWR